MASQKILNRISIHTLLDVAPVSVKQAATQLGVPKTTVYKLYEDNASLLLNVKYGKGVRVIANADIVFAHDTDSGQEFCVYGMKSLRRIVKAGKAEKKRVIYVELDADTYEFDLLLALVETVKGRHDYKRAA